ncbi:MAG: polymerase [Rhizobacter sp.]
MNHAPRLLPLGNGSLWWAVLALCAPTWLAYSVSPSATFLNQAAAITAWGCWLAAMLHPASRGMVLHLPQRHKPGFKALVAGLSLVASAALVAWLWQGLPLSLALSAFLMVLAAGTVLWAGVVLAGNESTAQGEETGCVGTFRLLAIAMVIAGLGASVIAVLQVFAPQLGDGRWLAISGLEGRATGNFRQPNHLGSLLLWSMVALLALGGLRSHQKRSSWVLQSTLLSILMFGVVLTASRTAALALLVLAAWGLVDRRLPALTRALLLTTPLLYAVIWWGLTVWAQATGHAFGGEGRFSAEGDISSSRFAIWRDTLVLIAQHPWTGVGWGRFNFAWSLTPFPNRPTAFFDHTHNLFLQFAVELGIPVALLVTALLMWAFWCATINAWRASGAQGVVLRGCWVMLLLLALHSQLEYPLWYAYFLLPTAFVWGLCLGGTPTAATGTGTALKMPFTLRVGTLMMAIVGMASVVDYWRVVVIYAPPPGASPLGQRIEDGARSLLFAHHAQHAAATTAVQPVQAMPSFSIATHHLLDTRLMVAWAEALNAAGDVERARHIAARLREFRNKNAATFFEACDGSPSTQQPPFQCTPPSRVMDWRDFK